MPDTNKSKFEIIVKYTCITFTLCTLAIIAGILLIFWKCTPVIRINGDNLEILNGAISINPHDKTKFNKTSDPSKHIYYKEIVNKDCSYSDVECLAGCVNFVKNLSKNYLLPKEHIYMFTEKLLLENGNVIHKDSLTKLDQFLASKEQLNFNTMPNDERIKLLSTLTKNFGNVCKESQCIAVDEIKGIHHPLLEQTKAIYGLEGQDNLAGPIIFIFARQNDKRFLFYSSVKAYHKTLCTNNQLNCNYCEIDCDHLDDLLYCQKSNKIANIAYKRALEMIENFEIISDEQ